MTDLDALALTIWGEARGEPIEGKIGVAMVMRNRLLQKYRGASSYVDVVTAKAQFSCWTEESSAMGSALESLLAGHPTTILALCVEIARATINGYLSDNTHGANHYYANTIQEPVWAKGSPTLASLGHHRFYNVA